MLAMYIIHPRHGEVYKMGKPEVLGEVGFHLEIRNVDHILIYTISFCVLKIDSAKYQIVYFNGKKNVENEIPRMPWDIPNVLQLAMSRKTTVICRCLTEGRVTGTASAAEVDRTVGDYIESCQVILQ